MIFYGSGFLVSGDDFYYDSWGAVTLPLGTITIQETKAPEGYKINPEVFIRQITSEGTAELVDTYNPPTILEERATGEIELTKIDSISKRTLQGATYGLFSNNITTSNGKIDEKYKLAEIITDKNGKASLSDLEYGTYYIQEITAPSGYQMNFEIYNVVISDETNTVKITAEDTPNLSNIKIVKTSEDDIIANLYFNISSPYKDYGNYMTGSSGIIYVGSLPVYDSNNNKIEYTITELGELQEDGTFKMPDRYKTPKSQKTTLEYGETTILKFENILKTGSVSITKTDEKGKILLGAEFKLYFANGDEVKVIQNGNGQYMYSENGTSLTLKPNTSNAQLFISGLPQGDYYLIETKSPNGYMPYGDKVNFVISAGEEESIKVSSNVSNSKLLLYDTGGNGNIQIYIISTILLISGISIIIIKSKKRGNLQ